MALRRLSEFQRCLYEPQIAPLLIRADNLILRIAEVSSGFSQGEEDKQHHLSQAHAALAIGTDSVPSGSDSNVDSEIDSD